MSGRCPSGRRPKVISTSTAQTTWDRVVAKAAPITAISNTTTSSRSSTIFTTAQTPKKITGRLESPIERRMPLPIL